MKQRIESDIYTRSQDYALRSVQLSRHLYKHNDPTTAILARQFLRAATSVGANLVEAKSGESRRDFIHKATIAQKEARESHYWLTLISRAELIPPPASPLSSRKPTNSSPSSPESSRQQRKMTKPKTNPRNRVS